MCYAYGLLFRKRLDIDEYERKEQVVRPRKYNFGKDKVNLQPDKLDATAKKDFLSQVTYTFCTNGR